MTPAKVTGSVRLTPKSSLFQDARERERPTNADHETRDNEHGSLACNRSDEQALRSYGEYLAAASENAATLVAAIIAAGGGEPAIVP